ncbi:MAG: hypothetical protein QM796_20360 [Chthoniobacteraceae bacterium]
MLERENAAARVLAVGEKADLSKEGIEKFRIEMGIEITVVNEDNGKIIKIAAFPNEKIEDVISRIYDRFKVEPKGDDRLRCEVGNSSVFEFKNLTVREYVSAGHCACLVWLFASGTGGAVMPVMHPALADPEIAAAVFEAHLDELWKSGRPDLLGWRKRQISSLQTLVTIPGRRANGAVDDYHVLLGAKYYDNAPCTVEFVNPVSLSPARLGERWFPSISPVTWF